MGRQRQVTGARLPKTTFFAKSYRRIFELEPPIEFRRHTPSLEESRISWAWQNGEKRERLELLACLVSVAYLSWAALTPRRSHLIDLANLGFHELGHILFFYMGEFFMFLGGTIGQLAPQVAVGAYAVRSGRKYLGLAAVAWFGQSLANVSVYIGDARAQKLELLFGGRHDWNYLLGRLGLLHRDTLIATLVWALGLWLVGGALVGATVAAIRDLSRFPSAR
jgi:hypothetical protein